MGALFGSEELHRIIEDVCWLALAVWCIGINAQLDLIEKALKGKDGG